MKEVEESLKLTSEDDKDRWENRVRVNKVQKVSVTSSRR
jgi:hypothetical protein